MRNAHKNFGWKPIYIEITETSVFLFISKGTNIVPSLHFSYKFYNAVQFRNYEYITPNGRISDGSERIQKETVVL
jgi:hypothetical protein